MSSFTIPTELCQAQFTWTGVQTLFPCGFPALDPIDLLIQYTAGVPPVTTTLIVGVHVSLLIDAITHNVSLTPLAMPAPPGTLIVTRTTPAVQPTLYSNLETYQADSLTLSFDRAMMAIAECKRRIGVLEGGGSSFSFNITAVTAGAGYVANAADDLIIVNKTTGSPTTVTMAASALRTRGVVYVKDGNGDAATNNITVAFNGTEKADGLTTVPIRTAFGSVALASNPAGGWVILNFG